MKLLDGKSILLGAGLGVILTALLGLLFTLGTSQTLTDAQIIARAEKLGMVHRTEYSGNGIEVLQDGSWSIQVFEGEDLSTLSGRLYNAGLIKSAIEFQIVYKKNHQSTPPVFGAYRIEQDLAISDLADRLAKGLFSNPD